MNLKHKIRKSIYSIVKRIVIFIKKIQKKDFLYNEFNQDYAKCLNKFGKYYVEKMYGREIKCLLNSDLGLFLYLNGSFESDELDICKKYIKQNGIIFDIGANVGTHSVFFATLATKGLVFAVEPSLNTFSFLVNNVKNERNIYPLNIALSNKNGLFDFYEAKDSAYSSLKDTKRKRIISVSKVLCYRLDYLISVLNLDKIDFVKIDVEGYEQEVLEGMENIIRRFKPIVFCEIYGGINSNKNPLETINYMRNMEYIAKVVRDGLLSDFREHNDNFQNYFFIPQVLG